MCGWVGRRLEDPNRGLEWMDSTVRRRRVERDLFHTNLELGHGVETNNNSDRRRWFRRRCWFRRFRFRCHS